MQCLIENLLKFRKAPLPIILLQIHPQLFERSNRDDRQFAHGERVVLPNEHRPGANGVRHETEALLPGSVEPMVLQSFRVQ